MNEEKSNCLFYDYIYIPNMNAFMYSPGNIGPCPLIKNVRGYALCPRKQQRLNPDSDKCEVYKKFMENGLGKKLESANIYPPEKMVNGLTSHMSPVPLKDWLAIKRAEKVLS